MNEPETKIDLAKQIVQAKYEIARWIVIVGLLQTVIIVFLILVLIKR